MNYQETCEAQIEIHFRLNPSARKYDSAKNRQLIVERVLSFGIIPSEVGVLRAIRELVTEGIIGRVDGGSDATDAENARLASEAAAKARIAQIQARPLTQNEFDSFVRLSPDELAQKYYADGSDEFKLRYDMACSQFGFRKPSPRKSASAGRVFV